MQEVKSSDIVKSVLDLHAVGEIGRIANAQAGLNHSGLLDMSNAFSMSDVIDAVNYRSGDVSPVYKGLLETYCDALASGKFLAESAAVERVIPEVVKHWNDHGYTANFGEIERFIQSARKRVAWLDKIENGRELGLNSLQLHLNMRMLRANGPVKQLVEPALPWAYSEAAAFQDYRASRWREYFSLKQKAESDHAAEKLSMAQWIWHAKNLNREINQEFRNRLLTICSERGQGFMFLRAYLHTEVIKPKVFERDRRKMIAHCQMRPVIEAYAWAQEERHGILIGAVETFVRNSEETVIIKAPSHISGMPLGCEFEWIDGMLSIHENSFRLVIQDNVSFVQLEYAAVTGERKYRFKGWAGHDSEYMVLTPIY